mmetsp:Transcript_48161/g.104874  ORF Transcript_48161/g.104874 Transcript_48161/m.104874 type:complete len:318 (-) Transcript_48161:150-1103(-)
MEARMDADETALPCYHPIVNLACTAQIEKEKNDECHVAAHPGSCQGDAQGSLNSDPYNVQAEEQALAECMRGMEVRRTWSEQEMVRSFDGRQFSGTPDGMFESWDGALTCVQVVRVPLLSEMSLDEMQSALLQTVVTKIVKSQQWLRVTHVVPADFAIFCWLPFQIPEEVAECAMALMGRVRTLDPRFSLRLRVPAEAGALFPALFAHHHVQRKPRSYAESDVSTFVAEEAAAAEEEEGCDWDITWSWNADWAFPAEESSQEGDSHSDGDECEWDITWDWGCDSNLAFPVEESSAQGIVVGSAQYSESMRVVWDDKG